MKTDKSVALAGCDKHWVVNRVGLLNFWHYDEEEFEFAGGRLLLRGANGSGKSVTMQSFIPLLLDGNKSPERLDPFGSRARRLENYLLGDDDLEEDERTGYLYMELRRAESDMYLTIGMGLHARRGKPLDSWMFVITDGRRIGRDLALYKDVGDKIPLTRQELRNRVGDNGGQVFDKQKDYMAVVNRLLFGFDDLDDYDELIKLLIQLRTPKLSKDFRPSVIYDILEGSLQPLSDDDLRPLSEAVENMDSISTRLESLRQEKRAAESLMSQYDRYNRYVLREKAAGFLRADRELEMCKDRIAGLENERCLFEEESRKAERVAQELRNTRDALEAKRDQLAGHDSFRVASELEERRQRVDRLREEQSQKTQTVQQKKSRVSELSEKVRKAREQSSTIKYKMAKTVEQMGEIADRFDFHEHSFIEAELESRGYIGFPFQSTRAELQRSRAQIVAARKKLEQLDKHSAEYDRALEDLEKARQLLDEARTDVDRCEVLLEDTKSEFIEHAFEWRRTNEFLVPSDEDMVQLRRAVARYPSQGYDDVIATVRPAYRAALDAMSRERSSLVALSDSLDSQIKEREDELSQWLSKREPEPDREEKTARNRVRLAEKGVPAVPFYEAVDFKPGVPAEVRNRLEEALLDLGILDALIVPESSMAAARQADPDMADKYLHPSVQLFAQDLSAWLRPVEPTDERVSIELVDSVIKGIMTEDRADLVFVSGDGTYGIGNLLEGRTSSNYEARFIGGEARRRYRNELIAALRDEIARLQAEKELVTARIADVDASIEGLERELSTFPDKNDLETAYNALAESRLVFQSRARGRDEATEYADRCFKALQRVREEVKQLTRGFRIPVSSQAYEEAEDSATQYSDMLSDLASLASQYESGLRVVSDTEERVSELAVDLSDLGDELEQLSAELDAETKAVSMCETLLQDMGFDAIQEEIRECIRQLSRLPGMIEDAVGTSREMAAKAEKALSDIRELSSGLAVLEKAASLTMQGFAAEYELGYVCTFGDVEDIREIARRVFRQLERERTLPEGWTREQFVSALQERYHEALGHLYEYNLRLEYVFGLSDQGRAELEAAASRIGAVREASNDTPEIPDDMLADGTRRLDEIRQGLRRLDLRARVQGRDCAFKSLLDFLADSITENENLLRESDRQLFEDVLVNTVSKKIRARIYRSEQWVDKMNALMGEMNTSSGLSFSLSWRSKPGESELEMDTAALVELLKSDARLLRPNDLEALSRHFRSRIDRAKKEQDLSGEMRSFHAVIRDVLDYRRWFEFQLQFSKDGLRKRELTNTAFDRLSGGEKAMAMYVPLFSAVYARYENARHDCLRIISLDEAFAGVDENNIRDMFRLLTRLDLGFIINSQVLWGDYDTVPSLSICELIHPPNSRCVSVIRYRWDGKQRHLVTEKRGA